MAVVFDSGMDKAIDVVVASDLESKDHVFLLWAKSLKPHSRVSRKKLATLKELGEKWLNRIGEVEEE